LTNKSIFLIHKLSTSYPQFENEKIARWSADRHGELFV